MACVVYLENSDTEGKALVSELFPHKASYLVTNPRYFKEVRKDALFVLVRSSYTNIIQAYEQAGVQVGCFDAEDFNLQVFTLPLEPASIADLLAGNRTKDDHLDVPVDQATRPDDETKRAFALSARGETGWWDVKDEHGDIVSTKALRLEEAEAFITQLETA